MYRSFFCGAIVLLLGNLFNAAGQINCEKSSPFCTERFDHKTYEGTYIGHDEPALLFYSSVAGSGNSNIYRLTIPTEPPTPPNQSGTGGTYNFQLHPAFWFGMAMCDNQSAPNPGSTPCTPDSDSNIFTSTDPGATAYIGKHPGAAFLELQFYPPGWVLWPPGTSCDGTRWCAALNIDSFNHNLNTGQLNNSSCLGTVGEEPVNFAFITRSGVPIAPPGPLTATLGTFTPDPAKLLLMNPGDEILVTINDTPAGVQTLIQDLTTGQSGVMVASVANGFAQVNFTPSASSCTQTPYSFHPMYSTSSEQTRVPWAAHSYNVAFSDEIGHFEYCSNVNCSALQAPDEPPCFPGGDSPLIQIGGCLGTDSDFDGVPYQRVWPGTFQAFGQDKQVHPSAITFSSPKFVPTGGGNPQEYGRVAFEADLPSIEDACDVITSANCVNPPAGANFYPIYTTTGSPNACRWQFGGVYLPGTKDTFGGTSTAEYGSALQLAYPSTGDAPIFFYTNFRQVLAGNPCLDPHN